MPALLALLFVGAGGQEAPGQVVGPGLLCLKYSSFELLEGERVIRASLSIETMHLELEGPRGRYSIHESEILAKPDNRRLIATRRDARIYAVGAETYVFRGKVPWSLYGEPMGTPTDAFLVVIGGAALESSRDARPMLSRLRLGIPAADKCIMRYQYGWEYILPPETE